jgi:hypothetical protein
MAGRISAPEARSTFAVLDWGQPSLLSGAANMLRVKNVITIMLALLAGYFCCDIRGHSPMMVASVTGRVFATQSHIAAITQAAFSELAKEL